MSDLDFFRGEWSQFREWERGEHGYIREELKGVKEKQDKMMEKIDSLNQTRSYGKGYLAAVFVACSAVAAATSFVVSVRHG